jgi:transposase-like protein
LIYSRKRRVTAFIIDETMIQIGPREAWLWVAIEPVHSTVLGIYLSRHRNMLVVESFLRSLIKIYGRHNTVYSDGGTWYPEACVFLGLEHRLHSSFEKNIIERAIYNTSKIEQRILTITIRVGILGLILIMYIQLDRTIFMFMHHAAIRHIKFSTLVRLLEGDQA